MCFFFQNGQIKRDGGSNLYNGEEFINDDTVRVKEEHEVSASQLKEKDVMLFGVRIKRASKDFQGKNLVIM